MRGFEKKTASDGTNKQFDGNGDSNKNKTRNFSHKKCDLLGGSFGQIFGNLLQSKHGEFFKVALEVQVLHTDTKNSAFGFEL